MLGSELQHLSEPGSLGSQCPHCGTENYLHWETSGGDGELSWNDAPEYELQGTTLHLSELLPHPPHHSMPGQNHED